MVLCVPTGEEVTATGRSISARHSKMCRSEGYLATQSGGGIPVSSPACSPTSSLRRSSAWTSCTTPSSTHAGTATSLHARYLRQARGRYACCCPLPTWTLAGSSFVTTTEWLRVRPLAVGSFFSGVRGHLCHSSTGCCIELVSFFFQIGTFGVKTLSCV